MELQFSFQYSDRGWVNAGVSNHTNYGSVPFIAAEHF